MCSNITYAERLLFFSAVSRVRQKSLLEIVKDPRWYKHNAWRGISIFKVTFHCLSQRGERTLGHQVWKPGKSLINHLLILHSNEWQNSVIYISRLNGHPIKHLWNRIKNYNFIKSHNHKAVIMSLGTANSGDFPWPHRLHSLLPTIYICLGHSHEKHCQHQYLTYSSYIFFVFTIGWLYL